MDDFILDVSNADQVAVYPKMDIKILARYPHLSSPEALYAVFKKIKNNYQRIAQPIAYDPAKGFQYVEEHLAKEADILVEKGYCKPEIDSEGKRSLTWKGACLLAWVSVFPGNKLKNRNDLNYAKKLLASV